MTEVLEALTRPVGAEEIEVVGIWPKERIQVVVGRGETNGYWRIFGAGHATTVSVDEWR